MCGHFASWADKNTILKHFQLMDAGACDAMYNVYPSAAIPVVRPAGDARELVNLHWSFIPCLAKHKKLAQSGRDNRRVEPLPFPLA